MSSIVEPFVKREFTMVMITSISRSESLGPQKETSSSTNHPFSGALDVSFREGKSKSITDDVQRQDFLHQ